MVKVVGKEKPTRVFELIARAGEDLSPEHSKLIQSYAAGLEAFRGQHWDEAEACFKECLDLVPSDGPARTLLERCAVYRREPPPPDWDGVFEATKK